MQVTERVVGVQLALDGTALELELVGVVDVLPLAAAARAKVGAGRRYPAGRGLQYLLYDGRYAELASPPVAHYAAPNDLAGDAAEDVHLLAVQVGDAVSEGAHTLQGEVGVLRLGTMRVVVCRHVR